MNTAVSAHHELRYVSLFNQGRALSFPSDGQGHVDMDALSEPARENYLYARTMVGVESCMPVVRSCDS
jgi:hypothetical protein